MTSNLLEHQSDAVGYISQWKVGALFMEAGTGKTRVAMELVNQSPCSCCVWIGPLRTLENAKAEISRWGGFRMPVKYVGVESLSLSDRIYHETLEDIEGQDCPFVVVDESLKIKNAGSKRTKRMLEIGKRAEYKLILNGTPLSRNVLDLWSQMEFISPLILNMSLQEFKSTFCCYTTITKREGWRKYTKEIITGYENIDYLYSLIRNYVYECDLHLNITQNYRTVNYYLDEDERAEYDRLKEYYLSMDALMWYNNNIFFEMTQKMQHSYCCAQSKIEAVHSIFEEGVKEEDTIIFCKYIDSRVLCEREFPKAKVLSYQKESFGLNLQAYKHTIYFDKIWDYALRMQSERRTYRTGQEFDCKYWDLEGDVGLERMIEKNIRKKIGMVEYFKRKTKEDIMKEL